MAKRYCIVCGKEKKGIEIEHDIIIKSIRWFKRNVTKNEKNNVLVVCSSCYPLYKKSRDKFELRERLYIALGLIFFILMVFISHTIASFIAGLVVIAFLYLLSLMNYMPKLDLEKAKKIRKGKSSR
ncbi:hypothetical protein M1394_00460 [Candidatus Marsarchaeota archaeon]|nr:hypothetical protein [Candidatus Marsarchaeota archaeon]